MTDKRPPTRAVFREHPNASEALALDRWMLAGLGPPGAWATVRPSALGLTFDVPRAVVQFRAEPTETPWGDTIPSSMIEPGIAMLNLTGPIEHHSHWYWNNYEDLAAAIEAASACPDVKKIILKIDSPGGVAAGMQEAHKAIRGIVKTYGKSVIAWVDEMACSAAFHVASACSEIWMPESAQVGSVGVILCTIDETEALDKAGLKIRYVVTGKRKADMHPGQPVTDEVLRVAQDRVDHAGRLFFESVARARGLTADQVRGYEAAVFCGQDAIDAGYADGITTWPKFLDLVRATMASDAPPVPEMREKNAAAVALGRRGGLVGGRACAEKLTPKQRASRARKAGMASAKKRRELARA